MSEKHKWIKSDDLKVLYIAQYGYENIPYTVEDIATMIGTSVSSVKMRIGNFKAIESGGKTGLEHSAKLSKEVYNEYKDYTKEQLRKIAFNC